MSSHSRQKSSQDQAGPGMVDEYEVKRLKALDTYQILDTPSEEIFDDIVIAAASVLNVPIATISFVDRDRQWFKAKTGLGVTEINRSDAFCAHAVAGRRLVTIADLTKDERFKENPYVCGPAHLRFYAGIPLTNSDGFVLGTFCILDTWPRVLQDFERQMLARFARITMAQLDQRLAVGKAEQINSRRDLESGMDKAA